MKESAGSAAGAVEAIAAVAEENSAAAEEVSAATEQLSARVQEVVASASILSQMAGELDALVARFTLESSAGGAVEPPQLLANRRKVA